MARGYRPWRPGRWRGVHIDRIAQLRADVVDGRAGRGVFLVTLNRPYSDVSGRLLRSGTTLRKLKVDSANNWICKVPDTGAEMSIAPRMLVPKPREAWTLADLEAFVICPELGGGIYSFVHLALERPADVGPPMTGTFVCAGPDSNFSDLVDALIGWDQAQTEYVWLAALSFPRTDELITDENFVRHWTKDLPVALESFDKVAVYLNDWTNLELLSHGLCAWQLACIQACSRAPEWLLGPNARASLLDEIKDVAEVWPFSHQSFNFKTVQSGRQSKLICAAIEDDLSGGMDEANYRVFKCLHVARVDFFLQAILDATEDPSPPPEQRLGHKHLLERGGAILEKLDYPQGALQLYTRLEAFMEAQAGTRQHAQVVSVMNKIALVYRQLHNLDESLRVLREVVEIKRRVNFGLKWDLAVSLKLLAILLQQMYDFSAARAVIQEVETIEGDATGGPDDIYVADTLTVKSGLAMACGELESALEGFEQALAIQRREYRSDNFMRVVLTRQSIAQITHFRGDLRNALAQYKAVLRSKELVLGQQPHISSLLTKRDIAVVQFELGDILLGLSSLKQVVQSLRRLYAQEQHHDVALVQVVVARVLALMDELPTAMSILSECSQVFRTSLDPNYNEFSLAIVEQATAHLLARQGELEEASAMFQHVRQVGERAIGSQTAFIALCEINIGRNLVDQGDLAAAQERFANAMKIETRIFTLPMHPSVALLKHETAVALNCLGDSLAALRILRNEVLPALQSTFDRHVHYDIARVLSALAQVHLTLGELGEARTAAEEAISIFRVVLDTESHTLVARAYCLLSQVASQAGDGQNATECCKIAEEIVESRPFRPSPVTKARLAEARGLALHVEGNLDDAAEALEGALEAIVARTGPISLETATCQVALARVLLDRGAKDGGAEARAIHLAQSALATRLAKLRVDSKPVEQSHPLIREVIALGA